ncbi:hypothetical protein ACHAXR_000710, partial [Thalassiosira sp. AJA248-18]
IAQDVYRAIRDEAHLLLERQLVCDALDLDPFELMRVSSAGDADDIIGGDDGAGGDDDADDNEGNDKIDNDEELLEKKKNGEVIARVKDMMRVISCTRTTTLEGYSSIHAIVQLNNDGRMQGVKENVRLHFSFLREPQHHHHQSNTTAAAAAGKADDDDEKMVYDSSSDDSKEENVKTIKQPSKKRQRTTPTSTTTTTTTTDVDDDKDETAENEISSNNNETSGDNNSMQNSNNNFTPKTIVTYKIDYSIDYGKMEQLLGVDIYALGKHPSVEEAVPMFDNDDEEGEEDD